MLLELFNGLVLALPDVVYGWLDFNVHALIYLMYHAASTISVCSCIKHLRLLADTFSWLSPFVGTASCTRWTPTFKQKHPQINNNNIFSLNNSDNINNCDNG